MTGADADDAGAALDEGSELRSLRQQLYLTREEVDGLRQMNRGVVDALVGSERAYRAVTQQLDLLSKRLEVLELRHQRKAAAA